MPVERRREDDYAFSGDGPEERRAKLPRPGARTQKKSEAPQKEAELAEGGGGAGVQQV